MRVQPDHWSILLDFCEQRPEIITNKCNQLHGRQGLNKSWEELAVLLNSLGLGEKTIEEWKKTLIDWKSKTKNKAAVIGTHQTTTGGGSPIKIVLNSFEERLLNLMGRSAVFGNTRIKEVGIIKRRADNDENNVSEAKVTRLTKINNTHSQSKYLITTPQLKSTATTTILADFTNTTPKRQYVTPNKDVVLEPAVSTSKPSTSFIHRPSPFAEKQITAQLKGKINDTAAESHRKKKDNTKPLEQVVIMHKEVLTVLNNISDGVTDISHSLRELVNILKK